MAKKYNIGLDIGTNSVGWAVVEADTHKILRKGKGKNTKRLWGVRLFDEASTAVGRRKYRSTRRRYDRRRERIRLLQEEFKSEIAKVDDNFFLKLKESFYKENDKINKTITLSDSEKKAMASYQNKYKTIYHLRNQLINSTTKEDIRLVYLAIHHIIKYRGNFLYASDNFNIKNLNVKSKLIECFNICNIDYQNMDFEKLEQAIFNTSKNDRKQLIKDTIGGYTTSNFVSEFVKMINANKFNFVKMLDIDISDKVELSFESDDYDSKYDEITKIIGDDIEKLALFKELYDMIFIKRLFKDNDTTSISMLMIKRYKTHENDLKFLKRMFDFNRRLYDKLFRNKNDYVCIYDKYLNNSITYDNFISELNKLLLQLFEGTIDNSLTDKYLKDIKPRMESGEFLPRITEINNGAFPYQLNKEELIKIIENQGKYYPFLLDKLDSGKYKLVQLLEFKIPYYVGPLVSEEKSKFAWMVKKTDGIKITPYNFDEIINKEETAEKFIKRMLGHCTYFLDEYAIANNSILYSKYKVMNELKQIKINGYKIDNNLQHKIIEQLFMKTSGSITDKIFKEYIRNCNDFNMFKEDIDIKGYSGDNKFANNLQSYIDFFGENGIFDNTDYTEEDADKVIELITIFDDMDILKSKVKKLYPKIESEKLKILLNKKYKGWGNLSKNFLTQKCKIKNSEIEKSIYDLMWETEENFMQILNNKNYCFQEMIKEHNKISDITKIDYKLVDSLATSPKTKKAIFQALKVVSEIVDYMKQSPESIIIEMARGEEKFKKRKDDRKKRLIDLYNSNKKTIDNYNFLISELNETEKLDGDKIFLYFIQEGKSLYSRRALDINKLSEYEIDHIIPRSLIKDDSLDNKALVYRDENQNKMASYVLPDEYRNSDNIKWWNHLKNIGLISAKKFYNLTRREYKIEDIEDFINRQLVETRQITKHVANILSNFYKDSKIIYLNANLSSDYRQKYELYKFRQINDYHHAHDAYLAAVLGEYKENYLKKEIDFETLRQLNKKIYEKYNDKKLEYGYVINSLDSSIFNNINELIDIHANKGTKETMFNPNEFNKRVEYNLNCNDILISRKVEIKSGKLFKDTIYPADKGKIMLKKNMPVSLYGGYLNMQTSYLTLVNYKKSNKIVGIPMVIAKSSKNKEKLIKEFLNVHLKGNGKDEIKILKDKIPFEILINYKGQDVNIKGYSVANKNCEISNALQLKIPKDKMLKWKNTLNIILNNKKSSSKDELSEILDAKEIIKYLFEIKEKYPLFYSDISKIEKHVNIDAMTKEELFKLIKELFNLYHCNSENANLKDFGLSDRVGRLSGNNITKGIFIEKSVTGLRESRYEF